MSIELLELEYLDVGEVVDQHGKTWLIMDTATPDDNFGERICLTYNVHSTLITALEKTTAALQYGAGSDDRAAAIQDGKRALAAAGAAQ